MHISWQIFNHRLTVIKPCGNVFNYNRLVEAGEEDELGVRVRKLDVRVEEFKASTDFWVGVDEIEFIFEIRILDRIFGVTGVVSPVVIVFLKFGFDDVDSYVEFFAELFSLDGNSSIG
ncbi:hypothetical protein BpHYR1_048197 [Brachionus plicatilis]|uniref:Uncharacterized protein n=1 Tax=Brachionus plicatilis TaxID=10195 RepID=A0A3M7RTI3_BRAPC|nr:hypothetical protein BpHYR1_048197 [Brachionus plicatilis]